MGSGCLAFDEQQQILEGTRPLSKLRNSAIIQRRPTALGAEHAFHVNRRPQLLENTDSNAVVWLCPILNTRRLSA